MQIRQWFTLIALSLALTACGSLSNQPDQLVRNAMQRQFKQDSRYNFSGHFSVQLVDNNAAFVPVAASDVAQQEAAASEVAQAETDNDVLPPRELDIEAYAQRTVEKVVNPRASDDWEEEGYNTLTVAAIKENTAEQAVNDGEKAKVEQRFVQHWFDSLSLRASGAVDLPAARFEIVPQIRYETPHALSYAEIPLQVNFQDWSIMADPAAIAPYMDYGLGKWVQSKPIQGKVLRLQMPAKVVEELRRTVPFKSLISTIPQAIDDAYASMDKKDFVRLEMDADGKRIGAVYRIGLKMNEKQQLKMAEVLQASILRQVREIAAKRPQEGFSEKDYAPLIKALEQMNTIYSAMQPEKISESEDEGEQAVASLMKTVMAGYLSSNEMYVGRRGSLLAMRNETDMPRMFSQFLDNANAKNKTIRTKMWFEYDYSQPRFLLDPHKPNVVDAAQHYPEIGEVMNKITVGDVRDAYALWVGLVNQAEDKMADATAAEAEVTESDDETRETVPQ